MASLVKRQPKMYLPHTVAHEYPGTRSASGTSGSSLSCSVKLYRAYEASKLISSNATFLAMSMFARLSCRYLLYARFMSLRLQ